MVRVLTAFQTDEVLYVLIWSTLTFHGLLSLFLSRLHTHARTHTHTRAHIIALSPLLRMSAAIHRQFSAQRACWCIRLSHTPEFVAKVKERREKNSTRMHSQKSNLHTHTHTHIHTQAHTSTHARTHTHTSTHKHAQHTHTTHAHNTRTQHTHTTHARRLCANCADAALVCRYRHEQREHQRDTNTADQPTTTTTTTTTAAITTGGVSFRRTACQQPVTHGCHKPCKPTATAAAAEMLRYHTSRSSSSRRSARVAPPLAFERSVLEVARRCIRAIVTAQDRVGPRVVHVAD